MKLSKATPVPWECDATGDYAGIIRHNGIRIAKIMSDITRTEEERSANAALIAAAPDLLAALEEVRADLFYQVDGKHGPRAANYHPAIVRADAILDKLKG